MPSVVRFLALTSLLLVATKTGMAVDKVPQVPLGPSAKTVDMICVNSEGEPIAGAEIYLFQYGDDAYRQFGPFQSDAKGAARCPTALFSKPEGTYDRWIYARVAGQLMGVARSTHWKTNPPFNQQGKVSLYPTQKLEGRVEMPTGFSPKNVTVAVRTLHVLTGMNAFDYESFPRQSQFPGLDGCLPTIFETHPNELGEFQIPDVPKLGRLYLVATGTGLGEAQWRNDGTNIHGSPAMIQIKEEVPLKAKVVTPDGKPAAGVNVLARLVSGKSVPIFHEATFQATTNIRGLFAISGLPKTEIHFFIRDPKGRWAFRPIEEKLFEPNGSELVFSLENAIVVRGRALDMDGDPVVGAGVSAITNTTRGVGLGDTTTDDQGRFEFRLPSGEARVYFNSLPAGLEYPNPRVIQELNLKTDAADVSIPVVRLSRK